MVVRNSQDQLIRGRTMRISGHTMVLEAEMMCILEALKAFSDFPNQTVLVETDSMLSVTAIDKGERNRLKLGDLTEQCRSVLRSKIGVCDFFQKASKQGCTCFS